MTVKANTDHVTLARARSEAAALIARALDHVERAAVCLSGALDHRFDAPEPTSGARLVLEGTLGDLRRHRETLVLEQSEMVDRYADSLRRAEGQTT